MTIFKKIKQQLWKYGIRYERIFFVAVATIILPEQKKTTWYSCVVGAFRGVLELLGLKDFLRAVFFRV